MAPAAWSTSVDESIPVVIVVAPAPSLIVMPPLVARAGASFWAVMEMLNVAGLPSVAAAA